MTGTQTETLTTADIIERINSGASVHSLWFDVLQDFNYSRDDAENLALMIEAARFLEQWFPGQVWVPSEFKALLDCITGRYEDAAEIARIRAGEALQDEKMTSDRYKELEDGGDEAFVSYLDTQSGVHVFKVQGELSGVVVFDGLRTIHDLRGH